MVDLHNIKTKIEEALPGAKVEIEDQSAQHVEHEPTGAHVGLKVIYSGFKNKSLIEQHQMIYDILSEEMQGAIHALRIITKAEQ